MLNSTVVEEYALIVAVMSNDLPWFQKFLNIYKVYQIIQYLVDMACYYAMMWWPVGLALIVFWNALKSARDVSEKLQTRVDILEAHVIQMHAQIDETEIELKAAIDIATENSKVVEIMIVKLGNQQLQTDDTDAKLLGLEEKVKILVANTKELSRCMEYDETEMELQSNLITENQIQIDATDAKLLELEEIVERIVDRTKEIPRLGTEMDELRLKKNETDAKLLGLEKDVDTFVDTLTVIKNNTHINMYRHPFEVARAITSGALRPSLWPSIYTFQRDNSPAVHSTEIIMKGICADYINTPNRARNGDCCIDWVLLCKFPFVSKLTIIADAYHGFTQYASSLTLEILVVTSINEKGTMAQDNSRVHYAEYPLVSYEWLYRFPSLEILDLIGTGVDLLSTSDIAEFIFLEDFPKLKVIRGVGSKTNMKLVRYCSAKGIVLE